MHRVRLDLGNQTVEVTGNIPGTTAVFPHARAPWMRYPFVRTRFSIGWHPDIDGKNPYSNASVTKGRGVFRNLTAAPDRKISEQAVIPLPIFTR